jgi:hypothetical protein
VVEEAAEEGDEGFGDAFAGVGLVAESFEGLGGLLVGGLEGGGLGGLGGLTSSRPKKTPQAARKRNMALMRFGNAYGHCFIHQTPSLPPTKEPGPNRLG